MNTETWLKPVPLPRQPTAFTVDAHGIYVSFGKRTTRFDLDGTEEVHLQNTSTDVHLLFSFKQFLYLRSDENIVSIDKFSGKRIDDTEYYWYSIDNVTVSSSQGKAFSYIDDYDDRILEITLNNDGTFGKQRTSTYRNHNNYHRGTRQVYLLPGETRIADSTGIIYNINDLTYYNNFPGAIQDLVSYGNTIFVRQGDDLISYSSNTIEEIDRSTLHIRPSKIFIAGRHIFGFYYDTLFNIKVFKMPLG